MQGNIFATSMVSENGDKIAAFLTIFSQAT